MYREPKRPAPNITIPEKRKGYVTQTRKYTLITPLFGGGVNPAKSDPVTVIRATEIRGHLRFWWRACRGGQLGNDLQKMKATEDAILQKMKAAEDAIWGAAAKENSGGHSEVQIVVNCTSTGNDFIVQDRDKKPINIGSPSSPYGYVAFPLNEKQGTVLDDVRFQLKITFPEEYRIDVEAALWAWETFGGIGARTRRGFGALKLDCNYIDGKEVCTDLPPSDRDGAKRWLCDKFVQYVSPGHCCDNVPHLAHNIQCIITSSKPKPTDVWLELIEKLKKFRQDRSGGGRGRSKWPEPSAIRNKTGQSLSKHTTAIPNPVIVKFPRAVFGLPIIFQFKDANNRGNLNSSNADPRKTNLQMEGFDRLASPLILKPLACHDGKTVGIATILKGAGLLIEKDGHFIERKPLILSTQEGTRNTWSVTSILTATEASQIASLGGKIDVLQAFLDTL